MISIKNTDIITHHYAIIICCNTTIIDTHFKWQEFWANTLYVDGPVLRVASSNTSLSTKLRFRLLTSYIK